MSDLVFEWNFNKSASNFKKHGVSFEEAKTIFTERIISARKADKRERKIYEVYCYAR